MNAISFLKRNADRYPEKTGFIFNETPYTYEQIRLTSMGFANYLKERGIGKGDKVCTMFQNSIELMYTYFSVLTLGAVVVPINFRFVASEVSYIINNSDAKAIVFAEPFKDVINQIEDQLTKVEFPALLNEAGDGKSNPFGPCTLREATAIERMAPDMFDEAFIMYTSGTTGKPKGVILTHSNMVWNQAKLINSPPLRHDEIMISPLPFFHGGGLGRCMAAWLLGGTVISWEKFDAARLLDALSKYRATFIIMVPAMARMLFALPNINTADVSSVKNVLLTAAVVPVPLKKQTMEVFHNAQIIDGYGLTENCSAVTSLLGEDVFKKPSSVGLPHLFVEVKIVNENYGEVEANVVGEIAVSGPTVMKGYYNDPEGTAETIRGGWLMTGDLGRKDEEGYLYIVGRKKDMIISGGENIYPAEIEAVLGTHPKIEECAVIGVPHAKWGETVLALLVLKTGQEMGEDEVEEFCKGRMAPYKRPRIVKFVDSLIKNAMGKTMKDELKKMYDGSSSAQ